MEKHEGLRHALEFELHWGWECCADKFGSLVSQAHGFHSLRCPDSNILLILHF